MKILVTGRPGQVVRSLVAAAPATGATVVTVGRPEFDLRNAGAVAAEVAWQHPTIVINAAACAQVDKAESDEDEAFAVNATGAGKIARACANTTFPRSIFRGILYLTAGRQSPYAERDDTGPLNVYVRSKPEGERQVAALCRRHLILRTSWVYSVFGSNFVLTMLRLAKDRSVISVVDDQRGNPTYAPHLADTLLQVVQRVVHDPAAVRWGLYHAAGQGNTSWCGFARAIFAEAAAAGLLSAYVTPIPTSAYLTPAKRPHNSRLACQALRSAFAFALPPWKTGVAHCVAQIAMSSPRS